jgi:hypothetical protein
MGGNRAPRTVSLGEIPIMRSSTFVQSLVPIAFGIGFIAFGIVNFIRVGASDRQIETKLQSVRAGKIPPETLTVISKYVDRGKNGGWPHVVFSGERQPKVYIAATIDFYNTVSLGDAIPGYYFPDGYFIPQNYARNAGISKWLVLAFGVLLGGGALAIARAINKRAPLLNREK